MFLGKLSKKIILPETFIRSDGCENKKEGLLHDKKEGLLHDFNTVPSKTKAEK